MRVVVDAGFVERFADFFFGAALIVAPAACTATSVNSAVLFTIIPAVTPTVRAIVVSRCPVTLDPLFLGIFFLQPINPERSKVRLIENDRFGADLAAPFKLVQFSTL